MVPFLAYKIQENAYGGLKPSTRSQLRRIARDIENLKASRNIQIQLKLKAWNPYLSGMAQETHEVVVTEAGYEYREASYRSLSEIARKITGVHWSGPAFFRLNRDRAARSGNDE